MYKEKLYALLKSLEVKNIEKVIDGPTEHIVGIGSLITKVAKLGAVNLSKKEIQKMYEELA